MICTCPKCNANIQIALAPMPKDGTYITCPECKKRFWAQEESFSLRAYKKDGKIYCLKCGHEPGPLTICRVCAELAPGYYVVQSIKPVRRHRVDSKPAIDFSLKRKKKARVASNKPTLAASRSVFIKLGMLVLLAILVVSAGAFYFGRKAEQEYSKNFILALYAIKSGTDRGLQSCSKISTDWKVKLSSGQTYNFLVDPGESSDLITIKGEVDKIMQKVGKPPVRFKDAALQLDRLRDVYFDINTLCLKPQTSYSDFTETVRNLENKFDAVVKDVKVSLPEELSIELKKSANKYKKLNVFISN